MGTLVTRRLRFINLALVVGLSGAVVAPASADELWVAPTIQVDTGGALLASNNVWPVTPVAFTRFAWAVPDDLQTFRSAKVAVIPHAPGGSATLTVYVCATQSNELVGSNCAGPFSVPFVGTTNRLVEIDISGAVAAKVGTPGATYLAVYAITKPAATTSIHHFAGLRFAYDRVPPVLTPNAIPPNSIDESKLTFDPATQTELNNAIAAVGLKSLAGLGGLPCTVNGVASTTAVTVDGTGHVSIVCTPPPPPPPPEFCCTLDAQTLSALTTHLLTPPTRPLATSSICIGNMGPFGTGACVDASTNRISEHIDTSAFEVRLTPGTEGTFSTQYDIILQFDILTLVPLSVQAKIVGISNACQLSVSGDNILVNQHVISEMVDTPSGPMRRVRTLTLDNFDRNDATISGCETAVDPGIRGELINALFNDFENQIVFKPVCWPVETYALAACPAP
jgi:hypothetical protein